MKSLFTAGQSELAFNLAREMRQLVLEFLSPVLKKQVKNSGALFETGILDSQGVLEVGGFIEQPLYITVKDEVQDLENFHAIKRIATSSIARIPVPLWREPCH